MSEHYDFHYQPTGSGAISGQQVLQQTEDAINELGDYVNDNVGGAMDVAQQALETAQNAETNAQTALDTANSFSGAIQSAQQDASTALSTAQTAQTTASNANNTAIQAQQDASNAVTTANNASGQVSTLSGTVTALGQRVTTAEGNIGQNTSDISALTTRVGTAEGNITTLQNDVSIAMGNASSAMATAGTVKQQAYVFRYSSTALVASSTNSNTLLDNTDNLKVGDKVIDSDGVLFSITAIDAQNSTFTIGTALIDLAQDSDVVHKSGNETVGGNKTFTSDIIRGTTNTNSTIQVRSLIGNTTASTTGSDSSSYQSITATLNYSDGTPSKSASVSLYVNENAYSDGRYSAFRSGSNNVVNLGISGKRWANVYATNYYYGSSEVEFSTKFVTTDTNQTVGGIKTFTDNISLKSLTAEYTVTGGGLSVTYSDKNGLLLAQNKLGNYQSGISYNKFSIFAYDSNNQLIERTLTFSSSSSTLATAYLRPDNDNIVSLGTSGSRWSKVYATNYYYGSNNVEFSTKFVTTDTAQTITERKTFTKNVTIKNEDVTIGTTSGAGSKDLTFTDSADNTLAKITGNKASNGSSGINFRVDTTDNNNENINSQFSFFIAKSGAKVVNPIPDNDISLGRTSNRWKDTCTCLINGLTPSSLGMPVAPSSTSYVDISSYITVLDSSSANIYTPPSNGYITFSVTGNIVQIFHDYGLQGKWTVQAGNVNRGFIPVLGGVEVKIYVTASSIDKFWFIPCQGNV